MTSTALRNQGSPYYVQNLDGLGNLIEQHVFLSGLRREHCNIFHDCASIRRFASQQVIFHEGGEADHFYLITTGNVALETFVPGCGTVAIQKLGSGDPLGWSWLFPPYCWHFTASTREPTEVISFNAAALRSRANADREFHDELITRVAQTLYRRLLSTRAQLVDLYSIRS
jgi:CRP-like cAMP-binding protein